jgi:hypothetical protein
MQVFDAKLLRKKSYHGLADADSNDNYFEKVMEKFILY